MQKTVVGNSRHISWLYLFLGGFLTAVLLVNLCRETFMGQMELLNLAEISRLKYLDINNGAFFIYVLRERLLSAILLCLLATTYVGTAAVAIYAAWMGMMVGAFLSVAAIRYGMKGIFLTAAGILPQYLFLVPACILLMNWCYQLCTALYFPHKNYESACGTKKQFLLKKAVQLLFIVGVVIMGSIMESYVNPVILQLFLKIF